MVGWGAFPLCDGGLKYVQGDFKLPLMLGALDPAMDKYELIDKARPRTQPRAHCATRGARALCCTSAILVQCRSYCTILV